MMPWQAYDPCKQAMTPKKRYTHTICIDSDLIYSYQGKWVGCKILPLSLVELYKQ